MFVERLAVAADAGVVEDSRLVFHACCRCREKIVAVKSAHESVDRGLTREMRQDFMISSLQIESQIRTFAAFLLNVQLRVY